MKLLNMTSAEKIAYIMTRLYENKLTTTSGGNLSIMDDDGVMWISPSGVDKAHLTADDIMWVTPDGVVHGKHRPSTEYPFHLAVLRSRPDLKAVLHAHPAALVAYSLERKLPDLDVMPGASELCGKIAIAKYALPGSQKLGDLIAERFAEGCDTVLLENHGVVLGADSLERAFMMFEALDYAARTGVAAAMLKKESKTLTADELALKKNVKTYDAVLGADSETAIREELSAMCARCCRNRIFTMGVGAFAKKIDGGFIITPDDEDLLRLTPDMHVRVEGDKCEEGKVPSKFAKIAGEIFAAHDDIDSIAFARAPYIMAFAVTDAEFNSHLIPEGYICLRNAVRHAYGTIENAPEEIVDTISIKSPIAIIENDCVIVGGTSLLNAYDRLEVLEFGAESLCDIAAMNGTIVPISPEEIREIEVAFNL
jgi:L-fuculose-phosphate aldolase